MIFGGIGAIVTVGMWSRIFPVLRHTRTFDPPPSLEEETPEQTLQEKIP